VASVRAAAVLLVAGCYAPGTPAGVVCDPAAPACPTGQVCIEEAGGHVCRPEGTQPSIDAPVDPPDDTAPPDPFAYITTDLDIELFQDFSAQFAYDPLDFPETSETFDNQPSWVFALQPPFPAALGVVAGRQILVLSGSSYEEHDFGQHAPNQPQLPDHLTGAMFVANLDGDPAIYASSSSQNAGDGSFIITPAWTISREQTTNNVRGVLFDTAGAFDNLGAPEGYLGSQLGIVKRSTNTTLVAGDNQNLVLVGNDLLVTRHLAASVELRRIATITHAETLLATSTRIRLGEGAPPAGAIAWALVDNARLALVRSTGALDVIAETTDPAFVWHAVAVPPTGHPQAGRIYILESNRDRDIDRILALSLPP
jgi:hypothetical protein